MRLCINIVHNAFSMLILSCDVPFKTVLLCKSFLNFSSSLLNNMVSDVVVYLKEKWVNNSCHCKLVVQYIFIWLTKNLIYDENIAITML